MWAHTALRCTAEPHTFPCAHIYVCLRNGRIIPTVSASPAGRGGRHRLTRALGPRSRRDTVPLEATLFSAGMHTAWPSLMRIPAQAPAPGKKGSARIVVGAVCDGADVRGTNGVMERARNYSAEEHGATTGAACTAWKSSWRLADVFQGPEWIDFACRALEGRERGEMTAFPCVH
ncbi:hypothetical protein A0H81_11804 [Grifola frondosa]|uniref:Uncharacterized protein n=1 Tax=Grifola frondosa TaxID=5627 RepID=A0A1C7LZT0_GRIFR|nr:hypothetical protein A0H81_11804 [Grifola frondosa]